MNNEQRKARLARWEDYRSSTYRRWRVYSTFLTGFLIGLLYVIIISKWKVPSQVFGGLIDQRTLILMFSGIMGGVIYTILVDGYVEMPRFVANKGDQFEAGLFGDILHPQHQMLTPSVRHILRSHLICSANLPFKSHTLKPKRHICLNHRVNHGHVGHAAQPSQLAFGELTRGGLAFFNKGCFIT